MKYFFGLFFIICTYTASAQIISGSSAATRKLFVETQQRIKVRDYNNALKNLLTLTNAEPFNLDYKKELAKTYFALKGYEQATNLINEIVEDTSADETCYQLAYTIYIQNKDLKKALNVIEKGLKKFPNSGYLYNLHGEELYKQMKDKEALESWELGIKKDPNYYNNYYNAAKVLATQDDQYVKTIQYAETFINIESFTAKTEEMKRILLASYQQLYNNLFDESELAILQKKRKLLKDNTFEKAFLTIAIKNKLILLGGINTNNLTMFRIRFLLDWEIFYAQKMQNTLYNYQHNLLNDGYFDAYNQWIFGVQIDQNLFKNWATQNATLLNKFTANLQNTKYIPQPNS